jgi:hypothetical protein
METLSLNRCYPWKKNSLCSYPWQRQYLNVDFLKYEVKRVKDVREWYNQFQKARVGDSLGEVYYYVVPVELNSAWKAAVAEKGDYNYVGLSALKNCLQIQLLMLVPESLSSPKEYSLIRIAKSKKEYVHNVTRNIAEWVILLEEYQEIDPSYLYVDVPFEKRSIGKFIRENIVNDEHIADSFQPVVSSAPFVANKKGGVSLSSFQGWSTFSEEFIETLKLMQPPEFSDLSLNFPKSLLKGNTNEIVQGIKFMVSERNILGSNYFSAFSTTKYQQLESELLRRKSFCGEYSIACLLNPRGDGTELFSDIISKFVKTEVTLPFRVDELKYDFDIDLKQAQARIDEDVWLQVANQRQNNPIVVADAQLCGKLRRSLILDWQSILEQLGLKKNTEHVSRVQASISFENILRVAKSMARDECKVELDDSILNRSWRLFINNAEKLVENPIIQNNVKVAIPEYHEDRRFNAVRAELSVSPLTVTELFENVKLLFEDIHKLQEYLDKLYLRGYIFSRSAGLYEWL